VLGKDEGYLKKIGAKSVGQFNLSDDKVSSGAYEGGN